MDLAELKENLDLFPDWEERYQYIISLGAKLPPYPEEFRDDTHKVEGCISQVWLHSVLSDDRPPRIELLGDSDSAIVKGLFAILRVAYSGKTAQAILDLKLEEVFTEIGLEKHLSPNRRNGFLSMVEEIQRTALVAREA
jgi:cysteine desulfuration protein SufE